MEGVGRALARIAQESPDIEIVLPAHRNPIVRDAILPQLAGVQNVTVTEPLPYGDFARMMSLSTLILSDSGGVQEEAPSLGKPVLVMRENTERPEAVNAGTVKLVGTNEDRIVDEARAMLTDDNAYRKVSNASNPYGDGTAATSSLIALSRLLGQQSGSSPVR